MAGCFASAELAEAPVEAASAAVSAWSCAAACLNGGKAFAYLDEGGCKCQLTLRMDLDPLNEDACSVNNKKVPIKSEPEEND